MNQPPLGLLVYGDNHLLLRGPLPGPSAARRMAMHWMVVSLTAVIDRSGVLGPWRITTKELREEIEWVVVLEAHVEIQPGVDLLVQECSARGVPVYRCPGPESPEAASLWEGEAG